MRQIKIGNKLIGQGRPVFVIAEVGSNHNGKLKQAKELIDVAKYAGADAVKFQTFSAENLYSAKTPVMSYLRKKRLIKKGETVYDLFKKVELPRDWHGLLFEYCRKKGIIFLSTPFDIEAVDLLEDVGVQAYKIASFEITHLPLLEHTAGKKKPIILSTGMADLKDIETALKTIYKQANHDVILLHCAINYPPEYADLNLRAIQTMRRKFNLPVGFSDHTLGITADIAAVSLGACVIEKHFTLNRKLPGLDHPFALEPEELKAMVVAIRDTEASLGSRVKSHTKAEEELYRLARRSLVAACDIRRGEIITNSMIAVKRPGYGIHPKMANEVIGRVTKTNIEKDDILTWPLLRKVNIRPASWHDAQDIWKWRNDKITRKFSFNTSRIPLKSHLVWFKKVLADKKRKIFIIQEDGRSVGMVRFDIMPDNDKTAVININIAPKKRGQGLGLSATKLSSKHAFDYLNIKTVIAKVKKDNTASLKMFSRAWFRQTEKDNEVVTMELSNSDLKKGPGFRP
ncbi:MAG: N-acetylneuraminate synthase [Candidatus Omnitrophota bacterium]